VKKDLVLLLFAKEKNQLRELENGEWGNVIVPKANWRFRNGWRTKFKVIFGD